MNLEPTGNVPPDYRVIAVEETRNWDPKVIELTGRMAGIYLVNFAEIVHICDLTGSYYARFICNVSENYIREPDGFAYGKAVWDEGWEKESDPADVARSKALVALGITDLKSENAGEAGHYYSERGFNLEQGEKVENPDPEEPLTEDAALDAVFAIMANGEEWEGIAPWKEAKKLMAQAQETPQEFLDNLFEFNYCEECGGDAEHHTVCGVPGIGNYFARCDYPPTPETNWEFHPVIQEYRAKKETE